MNAPLSQAKDLSRVSLLFYGIYDFVWDNQKIHTYRERFHQN